MTTKKFEKVYIVDHLYDRRPLNGIADLNGCPHLYVSIFDEGADDFGPDYKLNPISDDVFKLALEECEILMSWERARQENNISQHTHTMLLQGTLEMLWKGALESFPELQKDRDRYKEIAGLLSTKLVIDPNRQIIATGEFRYEDGELTVCWNPKKIL